MIHRRILDVASSDPEASLESIAEDVSGASPALVERVLDEYGDPARDTTAESENAQTDGSTTVPDMTETATGSETETESEPATDDTITVSGKQRRTLRALYERPGASQGDLAEELDVTRATVSRRLNAIPGFDWEHRRAFAESVFGGTTATDEPDASTDDDPTGAEASDAGASGANDDREPDTASSATEDETSGTGAPTTDGGGDDGAPANAPTDGEQVVPADIDSRLAAIESHLDALEGEGQRDGSATSERRLPPELAHKVVHACMESDRITEDEELDVLRSFMQE